MWRIFRYPNIYVKVSFSIEKKKKEQFLLSFVGRSRQEETEQLESLESGHLRLGVQKFEDSPNSALKHR